MKHQIQSLLPDWQVDCLAGQSQIGGGSYPGATLPTVLVQVQHPTWSAAQLESYLRGQAKPIIARIHQDAVQFDVRTLLEEEMSEIAQVLKEA